VICRSRQNHYHHHHHHHPRDRPWNHPYCTPWPDKDAVGEKEEQEALALADDACCDGSLTSHMKGDEPKTKTK